MRTAFQILSILVLLLNGCNNKQEETEKKYGKLTETDYKKDTLKTGEESIPLETATTVNEPQQKVDFADKDKNWLAQSLVNARIIESHYWKNPLPKEKEFLPEVLDEVFNLWMNDKSTTKQQANLVIISLGAASGQWLVDNYNMKWIIVTDSYGTDYAVIHKKWNIIAYPLSSVKEGVAENKKKFFSTIASTIQYQVTEGEKGNIEVNK